MNVAWCPAVIFGWPGPTLAVVLSIVGVIRRKAAWMVATAVLLLPFSLYLGLTPNFRWAVLLPLLPLVGARAISHGSIRLAWFSLLVLIALIAWVAAVTMGSLAKAST